MKPSVGKILDKNKTYNRDAIHVAIMECIAGEDLLPGQKLYFDKDGIAFEDIDLPPDNTFIVDPFLNEVVVRGSKFYVFVKPNTLKNLWHTWEHPRVDKKKK